MTLNNLIVSRTKQKRTNDLNDVCMVTFSGKVAKKKEKNLSSDNHMNSENLTDEIFVLESIAAIMVSRILRVLNCSLSSVNSRPEFSIPLRW